MKLFVAILLTLMLASSGTQLLLLAGAVLGSVSGIWLFLDNADRIGNRIANRLFRPQTTR